MEFKDLFIREEDFAEKMQSQVLPLLEENIKDGFFENKDKGMLHYRYIINEASDKTLVICHGFCEYALKYSEMIYYFYNMGYSVFILEHRGHGQSVRQVKSMSKVHVNHFQDYVDDFHLFMEQIVITKMGEKGLYLLAHSMGGAIGALYLEQHPDVFEKCVLSSPMIKMSTAGVSQIEVELILALAKIPFVNKMFVPGQGEYQGIFDFTGSCMKSQARYTLHHSFREQDIHYRTNGASLRWAAEAFNVSKKIIKNANFVKIPVILMQASLDDLVDNHYQDIFADKVDSCQLYVFQGAKHEIFNSLEDNILDYYTRIFDFFG